MSTTNTTSNNTWWPKCQKWLVQRKNDWIRAIFMIVFMIVLYLTLTIAVPILVVVQFVLRLVTSKANASLTDTGGKLSDYCRDIIRFISYKTDSKPWPFAAAKSSSAAKPSSTSRTRKT